MREVVANNEYYEIEVDMEKNRSYATYKGFWKSVDVIPDYLNDIERLIARLKPNFTTMVDLRDETGFKVPPPDVINLLIEAQKKYESAGFSKSVRVVTKPLEKLTSKRIGSEADVKEKVREFNSIEDAEAWLDE